MMDFILNRQAQLATLAAMGGPAGTRAVVFVSYGAGHAAALAPVARHLHGQGIPVVCLGLTTAPGVFARFGIEALRMQDIVAQVPSFARAERIGARLSRQARSHASVDARDTAAYLGVGFLAQVRQLGLRAARVAYGIRGRQGFCPVSFFDEWFRAIVPAVVVATSAPRSERAALEAASALDLPRLCLVDLYAPFEVQWVAAPEYADTICVLTDEVGAHLMRHGVPAGRIAVTGNPAFDRVAGVDTAALRQAFRSRHAIGDDERVVAWISQEEPLRHPFCDLVGDPRLPERVDDALSSHFTPASGVRVVIRLHPNEQRQRRDLGPQVSYSLPSDSLDELLCGVDCVLTSGSTVGLEAAMLGTPVAQFTGSIFSADLPLAAMGLALAIDSFAAIGPGVEGLFERRQGGGPALGGLRRDMGQAAALVAARIEQLYLSTQALNPLHQKVENHGIA